MPKQVFYAGLKTSGVRVDAGRRSEESGNKDKKKGNGNGDASKKRKPAEGGGRRKTRSDTQH